MQDGTGAFLERAGNPDEEQKAMDAGCG